MCEEIVSKNAVTKRVLFQQHAIPHSDEIVHRDYRPSPESYNHNFVYVELRNYENDYLLESWVRIDKVDVLKKTEVVSEEYTQAEHALIRAAIKRFDSLLKKYREPWDAQIQRHLQSDHWEEIPF